MAIPVFPILPGVTYSVHKRPTWATLEFIAVNGRRTVSAQQVYPLWEFELRFDFMKDQTQNIVPFTAHAARHDFTLLSELFLSLSGKYGQFYFEDKTDYSRQGQIWSSSTDGVSTVFTAFRTWGTPGRAIVEPVGGIKSIDNLYLSGLLVPPANYSFNPDTNFITFSSGPPPAGQLLTADFSFYYLCQFLEDQHDYDQFMANLWTLQSCKMRSVKR